jgi:hypothetical protein
MNAVLGADNQGLSASDVGNIQSLYGSTQAMAGSVEPAAQSVSQLHQLVQAMSAFDAVDAGEGDVDVSGQASLLQYREQLMAGTHVGAHVA